jgi:hypothetical protein
LRCLALGRGVTFTIWPDQRYVETLFSDGHSMGATREDTPQNRAEAAEQGYHGVDAVWRSLVLHEALHSLTAAPLGHRYSLVLRHECGAERHPYRLRLYEEACVLAVERFLNTGQIDRLLWPHVGAICRAGLVPLPERAP